MLPSQYLLIIHNQVTLSIALFSAYFIRVNEAFTISAMEREDMLSRQSALVVIHKEIQAKELQALKDEIIRLSR